MRLEIRAQNIQLTDAIHAHVDRRMRFVFGRFSGRIGRVVVRVETSGGFSNGADKRCRIEVSVIPDRRLVVEDADFDLFTAIDRAAERAGRTVGRELTRMRNGR